MLEPPLEDKRSPEEWARDEMVDEFGPRSVAWLLWSMKEKLHRIGRCAVTFKPGQEEPPWFILAVAYARRSRRWSVEVIRLRDHRRYRFRWHAWTPNGWFARFRGN